MKKIIIPIVIVLILGFCYVYYTQTETQGQQGSLISQNGPRASNAATIAVGSEIISLLDKLDQIQLDTKIFQEQTFQSLRDFSITLRPQAVYRANPFAPIGSETGVVTDGSSDGAVPPASTIVPTSSTQTPRNPASSARIVAPQTPSTPNTNNQNGSGNGASNAADDSVVPIEGQ